MDDPCLIVSGKCPGFRLHKLEVYNWGTFDSSDGRVHSIRPEGATTLLIGQNASGKSTLVDALLTLLVRPAVRNYNMAAGGHKQDRDEKSYIKGACGSRSRDDGNRPEVQFLRPGNAHYSAVLACFRNEGTDEAISLAQILHLSADGRAEKMYCFAKAERSIVTNCAGLESMERLRQQMERRGFKATNNFTEYHGWFTKAVGMRTKAMDVFNQTVAVKDIPSLNKFIRDHMLEAKPWPERIDNLLVHFSQLSDAYKSLVAVRRQYDLLAPIAETGADYRSRAGRLAELQRLIDATDTFFRQKTLDLLSPHCDQRKSELAVVRQKKERLKNESDAADEEIRHLKNEIDQAGGERLRQIPQLIKFHESQADTKREASHRYHEALHAAGISETIGDLVAFAAARERIGPLQNRLATHIHECGKQRDSLVGGRADVSRRLRDDEAEYQSLSQRRSNLPEALARLRRQLCEDLRLAERDLPFVAELLAVNPKEREWESSIEMVLRGFALSLLVPSRHYPQVSVYVDRTRLVDSGGRGQKLVYLRVGERKNAAASPIWHPHSLLRKLDFLSSHPLIPWVKGELGDRFDFRCCDTIAEFQEAQGLALTQHRHVKWRDVRHEKDDRERVSDPRYFVLGWDNREKCRLLGEGVVELRRQIKLLDEQIDRLDRELSDLRGCQTAAARVLEIADFDAIDFARHQKEVKTLEWERKQLEESNQAVRAVKKRLAAAESRRKSLDATNEQLIRDESRVEDDIRDSERLIATARKQIRARQGDGTFAKHAECFPQLDAFFVDAPLEATCLVERELAFSKAKQADRESVRQEIEPLERQLGTLMTKFLMAFPDERADLAATVDYLDSFLQLQEQIRREDLPRHEQRFKERLNENVTNEIGMLNGALRTDCGEIEDKIGMLNGSLRQLEYRPGTYMQLEPRTVRDPEIVDFKNSLGECLADSFEGTPESDEARYGRIEKLLSRLREDLRWRDKVIDVRRWFDFVARELDCNTGEERGYYEDAAGQSGGEKQKLAFTILVAAIAYQYDIDPTQTVSKRFHFVVVDEMLSKMDDRFAEYGLELFKKFGLQLLIVAPLDAKARVTEPYVGCYSHAMKDERTKQSEVLNMTAREFEEVLGDVNIEPIPPSKTLSRTGPR